VRRVLRNAAALACLAFLSAAAMAIDRDQRFDDPELQARYERLISEVRCLQCQNQSIKDSNVTLAADLRREIARMIEEGKTDEDIADFLVTRYGDFALYRPRMTGKTLILWIAPFLLVLLGVFALMRVVRHRMAMPVGDEADDGRSQ
jgi:cytochrome c-type biogenesis protein CcmH